MEADREQLEPEREPEQQPQTEESKVTDEEYSEQEDYLIAVGRKEPRDSSETLEEQIL